VEFEQQGEDRAAYGTRLLARLSQDLRKRTVSGTSPDMLERMRLFYLRYPQMASHISAPLVRKNLQASISAPTVRKSSAAGPQPLKNESVLRLSWTHLAELVRIDPDWKRAFYENECLKGNWSKRQLQRQIGSLLYERTGLSKDKRAVIQRARDRALTHPADVGELIRDPYILEFVGLAEHARYTESDLESALRRHGPQALRVPLPCCLAETSGIAGAH
jgi:hypothetical protein